MPAAPVNANFTKPDTSRLHPEPPDSLRTPFELDRHRIINCTAFRRLQGKTQVFAPTMHDHFRNRLTHSLEVAQIARCLARNCGGDPELAEAIALAHDLGHPPFSHAGEKALHELMAGRGGFNHNAHTVRVVEYLEHPYSAFRGLNLTRATLDGLRAHATRFDEPASSQAAPSLEARIASLADRITYDLHDLEDAIGAEIVGEQTRKGIVLWRQAENLLSENLKGKEVHSVRRPILDAILNRLLVDAAEHAHDLRFSAEEESALRQLESVLLDHVYRHPDVARADAEGRHRIHELFSAYVRDAELMPNRFVDRIAEQGPHRVICDYIAGMTDSFCSAQHGRHCPQKC